MNTILTKEGYLIEKRTCNEELLTSIRDDLTVEPYLPFNYGANDLDISTFCVYRETYKYLSVPKFYGIEKLGQPKLNKEIEGETVDFEFKGDLRPEQKEITNVGVKTQEGDPNAIDAPIDKGTGVVDAPPAEILRYVEQMPKPDYDVMAYFGKNMHYPEAARENNIDGRVNVQFVVSEDGSISDVKIVGNKRLGAGLEEEAMRLVSGMPRWSPGKQNGRPVKVYFTQPITFRLE
jgi:TonB family protein